MLLLGVWEARAEQWGARPSERLQRRALKGRLETSSDLQFTRRPPADPRPRFSPVAGQVAWTARPSSDAALCCCFSNPNPAPAPQLLLELQRRFLGLWLGCSRPGLGCSLGACGEESPAAAFLRKI